MEKIILPIFDNTIDYFDMSTKYEQRNDPEFDSHVLIQINDRLGKTKNVRTYCEGQAHTVEITGQNLDDEQRNKFWYDWVCAILRRTHRRRKMDIKMMSAQVEKLNSVPSDEKIWAFITLGFDDEKIASGDYVKHLKKLQQIAYTVSHLTYEAGAIQSVDYVLEKHRSTGIHHHAHFLFQFNKKVPPSTMINKIYAAKGVSEYVRQKNFVDYIGPQKPQKERPCAPLEIYCRYIRGDKKEEKLLFVEYDREWRNQYEIPHILSL